MTKTKTGKVKASIKECTVRKTKGQLSVQPTLIQLIEAGYEIVKIRDAINDLLEKEYPTNKTICLTSGEATLHKEWKKCKGTKCPFKSDWIYTWKDGKLYIIRKSNGNKFRHLYSDGNVTNYSIPGRRAGFSPKEEKLHLEALKLRQASGDEKVKPKSKTKKTSTVVKKKAVVKKVKKAKVTVKPKAKKTIKKKVIVKSKPKAVVEKKVVETVVEKKPVEVVVADKKVKTKKGKAKVEKIEKPIDTSTDGFDLGGVNLS